jgi:hypothetical protein
MIGEAFRTRSLRDPERVKRLAEDKARRHELRMRLLDMADGMLKLALGAAERAPGEDAK